MRCNDEKHKCIKLWLNLLVTATMIIIQLIALYRRLVNKRESTSSFHCETKREIVEDHERGGWMTGVAGRRQQK